MSTTWSDIPVEEEAIEFATDPHGDALTCLNIGKLAMRVLAQRSQEARAQALVGQDFAFLRATSSSVSFCVCDGVGSAYRGDFAAAYLAKKLVAWLLTLPLDQQDDTSVALALSERLGTWALEAHAALNMVPIAPETPAIVREVLEELRAEYGSETVFLAGRLDELAPRPDMPPRVQLMFCWMGNVRGIIMRSEASDIGVNLRDDDRLRWSTRRYAGASPRVVTLVVEDFNRLVVYTDGADAISQRVALLDDAALESEALRLLDRAANDDATVLDIRYPLTAARDDSRTSEGSGV